MSQASSISRRDFTAGAVVAGAAFGAGSRSVAHSRVDWQAGAPPEWDRVLDAARGEGQVNVAAFPALAEKLSAAFQRDTGIHLNFIGGDAAEQSARFEGEARAKSVTIDAMMSGGWELMIMRKNLLEPILPQLMLPGVAPQNFRDGKYKFFDDAGQYLLLGADYVFGWLVVNTDVVKPEEIKTWKDLLDPKYRGMIAAHDPRFPGAGSGVCYWLYRAFGLEFIKDLYLGQQVKLSVSNRALMEGVVRGTAPILVGGVSSEVERFRANFKNIGVVLPEDAPGYLSSGFSVIKQARGVPHPNAAKVFTNWYMSMPGQEVYESVMLEVSRRTDVDTGVPSYLVPRSGVDYIDNDSEEVFFKRFEMIKIITDALGQR